MDKWTPEELEIKAGFEAALQQAKDDYDAKVLAIWRDYNKAMQEHEPAPGSGDVGDGRGDVLDNEGSL